MYAQQVAYAVARAVAEVQPFAPERQPHGHVELKAGGAFGEAAGLQLQVGLEHERIDAPFFFAERAEAERAGDVGGTRAVVRPAVEEEQATGREARDRGGRGLVVDYGTVGAVGGNRGEGQRHEVGAFGPQVGEPSVDVQFGEGGLVGLVEPAEEAHHGHAVLQVGAAESVLLHGFLTARQPATGEGPAQGCAPPAAGRSARRKQGASS